MSKEKSYCMTLYDKSGEQSASVIKPTCFFTQTLTVV